MNDDYINQGRTNQKLETREKILASAQYFMNKGVKFSLEDIAKKSGISRATIYRYYSNVEVLSSEAGLDLNTESPDSVYESLNHLSVRDKLLGVQEYYNTLAIDHEPAFRNYLSIVISTDATQNKRGARRVRTLEMVLNETDVTTEEKTDIKNLLTILMGIEPLIVAKDVCQLDNDQSKKLLKWAMELILRGLSVDEK